jgi:hypothetical protein
MLVSVLYFKKIFSAGHRWLTPLILDTQKAEIIGRLRFEVSLRQIVLETLFQKNPSQKNG